VEETIATMARKAPIKRSDHQKNKGKKPEQKGNQPQKKDDNTYTSTEPSTVSEEVEKREEEEKKTDEEKNDQKDASKNKEDNMTPTDMIVEVPKKKDGETDTSSLATGMGTKKTHVAKDGKLTIIQKSKLMNWAEEQFLRANKIMTFEEASKDVKLHKAASKAMELADGDWAIVGAEAIKKLRGAMSDRMCLHRKVVKGLYMRK
jgi:hypothetical protein